uniref:cytochrome P450 711A1-like n=1 Tax=Erigeron canadensis TaxID=72917 RepID=UPI001CB9AE44|nr:cytochrome P450 711A1-like [Erigeron canadensis]
MLFRFHMGRQALVIVADAELCREAGIKKFKQITNRTIPSPIMASPIHQKGLLWIRDLTWSSMRNTIVSVYQPSHLATLVPMMQSYIEAIAQNIPEGADEDINLNELTLKIASDVIGKAAFGSDFGLCQPDQHQHQGYTDSFLKQHIYSTSKLKMDLSSSMSMLIGLFLPILQEPFRHIFENIPFTTDWQLQRTNKSLTNILEKIVDNKMQDRKRGSSDFLSLILNARESNTNLSRLFTPDYISGLTYEHFLAGSTTTSFTISTAVYLISGHPEVEQKLLEEIDAFGPRDQVPTADDLQSRFPYLDQVVKETMRFYTLSPFMLREAATDVKIGDYIIPKGTGVWMSYAALAKDPTNFPEPEKFKPERFDPNGDEEKHRHPYAYIPFGIGPRVCIGQKFALQEIKLALIHLYRRYVFRRSPNMKTPLEFEFGIVLHFKHGIIVRAIKRM